MKRNNFLHTRVTNNKKQTMKKVLLTIILLAGIFSAQAQTEKGDRRIDINALAKQYVKSNEDVTLKILSPDQVLITECKDGYTIEVKGKGEERWKDYDIKITHIISGSSETHMTTAGGKEYDLERGALFLDADRIVLRKAPQQNSILVIKQGDDGYRLKIEQKSSSKESRTAYRETDTSWDFNIPFKNVGKEKTSVYRPHSRFSLNILSDLEFGMGLVSAHSQADGMDVGFDNAGWEFILNNIINWEYRPFKRTYLSLGFGVDWRNYRMKGDNRFLKEDNKLIVAPYPDGADVNFSRVKVFSMTLELMLRQGFNKHVAIEVGPVVNFNTHASIKTRYSTGKGKDKERFKETSSNIHQKPVTVDFKAGLIINPIEFYFKYSPTNTLDTDYGPEFKSMSAGIIIGL